MNKLLYFILALTITFCSCKGSHEKNVEPLTADSIAAVSESDTVVMDTTWIEDHNIDSLSLSTTEIKETETSPVNVVTKLSKAYNEGYDNGYEDGYEDAVDRNAFQESYDESCHYKGKKLDDYEEGYDDGYDDGWYDGKADDTDSQEDEEYDY